MMSNELLNRATPAFRRGYLDGYFGGSEEQPVLTGPFAKFDYNEGLSVGQNDQRLNAMRMASGKYRLDRFAVGVKDDAEYGVIEERQYKLIGSRSDGKLTTVTMEDLETGERVVGPSKLFEMLPL